MVRPLARSGSAQNQVIDIQILTKKGVTELMFTTTDDTEQQEQQRQHSLLHLNETIHNKDGLANNYSTNARYS